MHKALEEVSARGLCLSAWKSGAASPGTQATRRVLMGGFGRLIGLMLLCRNDTRLPVICGGKFSKTTQANAVMTRSAFLGKSIYTFIGLFVRLLLALCRPDAQRSTIKTQTSGTTELKISNGQRAKATRSTPTRMTSIIILKTIVLQSYRTPTLWRYVGFYPRNSRASARSCEISETCLGLLPKPYAAFPRAAIGSGLR